MMKSKRYSKNTARNLLIFSLLLISIAGCSNEKPPATTNPIEAKLIRVFKEDYKLDIAAKLVGKTLWVYIPVEYDILTFDRAPTLFENEKKQKFNVRFISGEYESQTFDFRFYIDENPEVPKMEEITKGIRNNFTEKAAEVNMNAFYYLNEAASGYPDKIDFIVLVISDIKRGIEYKETTYDIDLQKAMMGLIPSEEFNKRTLTAIRGGEEIVNNKNGSYLQYSDINLADFIIKQTINRIQIDTPTKYEITSAADMNKLILETLWNVTRNYDFNDFFMVKINNMVSGNIISYSRLALEERFKEPSGGNSI